MAEIEERKKFWQLFYSPLVLIVLCIIFFFMVRAVWRLYQHEQISARDRQQIESQLAEANQRFLALQSQVAVLETAQGVDEEIRSKFNVAKPGEGVAVIVGVPTVATTAATTTPPTKSWWQKLLDMI